VADVSRTSFQCDEGNITEGSYGCAHGQLLLYLLKSHHVAGLDQMRHVVQSRRLSGQIQGGVYRTGSENLLGLRGMGQTDDFMLSCNNHLVLAHNGTAPDRMDTDLIGATLFPLGVAVIHILGAAISGLSNSVGNHQSRAAGSIDLL